VVELTLDGYFLHLPYLPLSDGGVPEIGHLGGFCLLKKSEGAARRRAKRPDLIYSSYGMMRMVWTWIRERKRKRTLCAMLRDPRSARGFRSIGQLEKGIGADRSTTERLLLAVGARKSDVAEEWTLNPL
jgi:hypothetical protein